jgi:PAS domain S-box-containing protein
MGSVLESRRLVGVRKNGTEVALAVGVVEDVIGGERVLNGKLKEMSDGTGLITIDSNGQIVSCNSFVIELFGYGSSEMLGNNVAMLMPQPYASFHNQYLKHYVKTGKGRLMGNARIVRVKHKDGSLFPVTLLLSEETRGNRKLFSAKVTPCSSESAAEGDGLSLRLSIDRALIVKAVPFVAAFSNPYGGEAAFLGKSITAALPKFAEKVNLDNVTETTFVNFHDDAVCAAGGTAIVAVRVMPHRDEAKQEDTSPTAGVGEGLAPVAEEVELFDVEFWNLPAMDAIVCIDTFGTLKQLNMGVTALFGYEVNEILNGNVKMLMPQPYRDNHDGYLERFRSSGKMKLLKRRTVLKGAHKDGSEFPIGIEIAEYKETPGMNFIAKIVRATNATADEDAASVGGGSAKASSRAANAQDSSRSTGVVGGGGGSCPVVHVPPAEPQGGGSCPVIHVDEAKAKPKARAKSPPVASKDREVSVSLPNAVVDDASSLSPPESHETGDSTKVLGNGGEAKKPVVMSLNSEVLRLYQEKMGGGDGPNAPSRLESFIQSSRGVSARDGAEGSEVSDPEDEDGVKSGLAAKLKRVDSLEELEKRRSSVVDAPGGGLDGRKVKAEGGEENEDEYVEDDEDETEFDIARRYRRLMRVLYYAGIRKATDDLGSRTRLSLLAMVALLVVCFAVWQWYVARLTKSVDRIVATGAAAHFATYAATLARQLHVNASSAWPSGSSQFLAVATGNLSLAPILRTTVHSLNNLLRDVYLAQDDASTLRASYENPIWNAVEILRFAPSVVVGGYVYGAWPLLRRYVQAGLIVAERAALSLPSGTSSVATSREWQFLISNGPAAISSAGEGLLSAETSASQGAVEKGPSVHGILFAVQVAATLPILFFVLRPLLQVVLEERKRIYGIYLVLPRHTVYKFAQQRIKIDVHDADDPEDKAVDDREQGGGADSDDDDQWMLQQKQKEFDQKEGGAPGPFASSTVVSEGEKKKKKGKVQFAPEAAPQIGKPQKEKTGRRYRRVSPEEQQTRLEKFEEASSRRSLESIVQDMRVRYLVPVLGWVIILLVMFLVSRSFILSKRAPTDNILAANRLMVAVSRIHFLAQELVISANASSLADLSLVSLPNATTLAAVVATNRALLRETITSARGLQRGMLYASTSGAAAAVDRSAEQTALFFNPQCLNLDASQCLKPSDAYYPLAHNGLDGLLNHYLDKAWILSNASAAAPSNPLFAFVAFVGPRDLHDGLNTSIALFRAEIVSMSTSDTVFQSCVFSFMVIGLYLFYSLMYEPFVTRMRKESERTAMLMSMMPPSVNVEGIITKQALAKKDDEQPVADGEEGV